MRREADFPGEPTTIGELMRTPQTTPTRDEAVLLPCPFCGSTAEIERYGDGGKSTIYQCTSCSCSLETGEEWGHGRGWNKRASAPAGAFWAERGKNAEARALAAEAAVLAVAPHVDSIVCYASTIDEHDGNRIAKLVNEAAAAIRAQANNEPGA